MAQPRQLCYEGRMNTFTATEKFRNMVPLNSELDKVVRQPTKNVPVRFLSSAGTSIILTGTYLLYPAGGAPFPGLFEFRDQRSGKSLCIDTRFCQGERGIALAFQGDSFDFRWDGSRMMFLPRSQPLILKAFPQRNGWKKCEAATMIPVEDIPNSGQQLSPVDLFLERNQDPWFGMVGRSVNLGNSEEKYLFAFGDPSVERAVFVWKPVHPQVEHGEPARRRRMVQVPASAPLQAKDGPKSEPKEKPRSYSEIAREYQIEMARYYMDPRSCRPPKPIPSYPEYLELLKQGKAI